MRFSTEPGLWIEAIRLGLLMAILFGLHLTTEQLAGVILFLGAIGTLIVRNATTPATASNVDDLKSYIERAPVDVINKAGVTVNSVVPENETPRGMGAGGMGTLGAIIGVGLLLGATVSWAAPAPPPEHSTTRPMLDASRLALGVDAGVVFYNLNAVDSVEVAPRIVPYLSFVVTDELSLTARVGIDPKYGRLRTTIGARGIVLGNRPQDRIGAALAVDRVWYSGDGATAYVARQSWLAGINLWAVVAQVNGRDLIYVKPQVSYDNLNGWDEAVYLGLNLVGGKP